MHWKHVTVFDFNFLSGTCLRSRTAAFHRPSEHHVFPTMRMGGGRAGGRVTVIIFRIISHMKMAASQGGGEAASALHAHLYCSGPQWNPGVLPHQHQQQHGHSARSLDRTLEDAVCSGALNLSGRKLREYPRMSYDLTDTTQAGEFLKEKKARSRTCIMHANPRVTPCQNNDTQSQFI